MKSSDEKNSNNLTENRRKSGMYPTQEGLTGCSMIIKIALRESAMALYFGV
jgi:hypothetical protein